MADTEVGTEVGCHECGGGSAQISFLGWCTNLQLLKMEMLAAKVPPSLQTAIRPKEVTPQPPPGHGQRLTDTAAQMLAPAAE